MQPLFGLIGFGHWGPVVAHALVEIFPDQLRWVCDREVHRCDYAKHMFPCVNVTTDVNQLLIDENLSAVLVATDVASHFDIASKALYAKKHVWVEKPLAHSLYASQALKEIVAREKKVLFVDHTAVYSKQVQILKSLLQEIPQFSSAFVECHRINAGGPPRDPDVMWDLSAHDLAILSFLFESDPTSVRATKNNLMTEIELKYESGLFARCVAEAEAPQRQRSISIRMDSTTISLQERNGCEVIEIQNVATDMKPKIVTNDLQTEKPLTRALRHFVSCIMKESVPITGIDNAMSVMHVLHAANVSIANSGVWEKTNSSQCPHL